ncbi:hypothetical protein ARMGADRAFT_1013533 [Armillaria gallica]|uniref:Uncharacterized protein n=1 Tax=Armillaria gallica TaxID=47427 RepID=A0A2H3DVQ1_ARMGA|nr:hypothetical protein ARMGADRAFT_1013533 [Armillaria gallica]
MKYELVECACVLGGARGLRWFRTSTTNPKSAATIPGKRWEPMRISSRNSSSFSHGYGYEHRGKEVDLYRLSTLRPSLVFVPNNPGVRLTRSLVGYDHYRIHREATSL